FSGRVRIIRPRFLITVSVAPVSLTGREFLPFVRIVRHLFHLPGRSDRRSSGRSDPRPSGRSDRRSSGPPRPGDRAAHTLYGRPAPYPTSSRNKSSSVSRRSVAPAAPPRPATTGGRRAWL